MHVHVQRRKNQGKLHDVDGFVKIAQSGSTTTFFHQVRTLMRMRSFSLTQSISPGLNLGDRSHRRPVTSRLRKRKHLRYFVPRLVVTSENTVPTEFDLRSTHYPLTFNGTLTLLMNLT